MVKRVLLFGGIVPLFSGLFSLPTYADIESATASSTFSIDVSDTVLQVTAPPTASIVLNPISSAAVFGSANVTVNVATNNATGYTMTMSVPTTDLTHDTITGENAPVIPTLESAAPQATFPANAWGYKVVGDNYNPVLLLNNNPSWVTDDPTNGTDLIIGLAAKVDGVKHSGTYSNTLTFNVVANPNANRDTITFDKNNESATGTMPDQNIYQDGASTISKNTFQLANMQFMGWATTASGLGEGVLYYGDESIYYSPNPGHNNSLTLYAQWAPAGTPSSSGSGSGPTGTTIARAYEIAYVAMKKGMYELIAPNSTHYEVVDSWNTDNPGQYKNLDVRFAMQDMTPEICASVTAMHDDYQALDIRDDKIYHITKMQDGTCWMTQNLDLDLTHDKVLTNTDTDLTNKAEWNPTNTTIQFSGTSIPSWQSDNNAPWSADSVDVFAVPGANGSALTTLANCKSTLGVDDATCMHYHTGNYYNYAAAVAENNPSTAFNNWQYVQAPNSICPKNWRLPHSVTSEAGTKESASDYNKLFYSEGIVSTWGRTNTTFALTEALYNKLRTAPIYLSEPHYITLGNLVNHNYYRVAGTLSSVESYYLSWTGISEIVTDENYTYRHLGEPVRCIAR